MATFYWKNLKPNSLGLAPMAGITDSPFRRICKKYGADFVMSEMISSAGIALGKKDKILDYTKKKYLTGPVSLNYAIHSSSEKPLILQIFGARPEQMANAAKILVDKFSPDGIDINVGCPARKVIKNGSGSALMDNPKKLLAIIEAVRKAVPDIQLSVKTRLGVKNENITKLAPDIEKTGINALIIHGRLQKDFFSGPVDYKTVKKVSTKITIPVIISGGIFDRKTYKQALEESGAKGAIIGQASCGNPFVFKKIRKPEVEPDWPEIRQTILDHTKLQIAYRGDEKFAMKEMRKHYAWYIKGFKNAATIRREMVNLETLQDLKKVLLQIDRGYLN